MLSYGDLINKQQQLRNTFFFEWTAYAMYIKLILLTDLQWP